MLKAWTGALLACGMILLAMSMRENSTAIAQSDRNSNGSDATRVVLREQRKSQLDLQVGGELPGLPHGTTRYVSREELLKLPQATYKVSDDPNFNGAVQISGVLLEELRRALGASSEADLVVAICADQYHSNFTRE